jgi:hypothetical protein
MRSPDFFVFGCERSGTTLLCALLTEHPDVCVLNDTFIYHALNNQGWPKAVRLFYKALARANPSPSLFSHAEAGHTASPDRRVSGATTRRYFSTLLARYDRRLDGNWLAQYSQALKEQGIPKGDFGTVRELLDSVFGALVPVEQRQKALIGEKTPIHSHMQSWLRESYPGARIAVLVRNPITNVAAIYKRRRDLGVDGAINIYMSYYGIALAGLLSRSDVVTVRYEDVVHSPKSTVAKVHDWLGVGSNPVPESFHYYLKQAYIGERIEPSRDFNLRAVLTERQQQDVVERCAPLMDRFYPGG